MTILPFVIIFTCVWWVVFFILLPIGNKVSLNPQKGHADSAPERPRVFIKALVTTILSIVFSYIILVLVNSGYLKS
jgi:predicted secreted protein